MLHLLWRRKKEKTNHKIYLMKKQKLLLIILILTCLTSCENKQIKITRDYIINEHWDKFHYRMMIEKMKEKDSIDYKKILSIGYDEPNYIYIVQRLAVDSTYNYSFSEYGSDVIKDTVYFNKNNGWKWGSEYYNNEKNTIGFLENSTWYKFSNLLMNVHFSIYVYVDSFGNTHQFHVNNANF